MDKADKAPHIIQLYTSIYKYTTIFYVIHQK
jgi:hypothetical protein